MPVKKVKTLPSPVAKVDEAGCAVVDRPLLPDQSPPHSLRIFPPSSSPLNLCHSSLRLVQHLLLLHLLQDLWTSLLFHFFNRPLFHAWLENNGHHHLLCVVAGSSSSVHDMGPVLARAQRQLAPPFHDENTGIADITRPLLARQKETVLKLVLILVTVSETGAGKRELLSLCLCFKPTCLSVCLTCSIWLYRCSSLPMTCRSSACDKKTSLLNRSAMDKC